VLEVLTDPAVPVLPPFPAGAAKFEQMRAGLAQEGGISERGRRLLETYASHEQEGR